MQGEAKEGGGAGGAGGLGEVKAKVDGLANLMQQLENARAGARRTRVGVILVVLLVFVVYIILIVQAGRSFVKNDLPELQAEALSRLPKIQKGAGQELAAMAQRVVPVYRDAVQKQLRTEWPNVREELVAQGNTLLEKIQAKAKETVESRLATMAENQKERVLEEFKDLDDATQSIIMENLEIAFRDATLNVLETRIAKAETQLRETHAKVLAFLPEGERDPFAARMAKIWDQFLLEDLGGNKLIDE